MTEIKAESLLNYMGFKAEEIKTEDDFKTRFEDKFGIKDQLIKDPTFTSKIYGQRVGSIEAKAKSGFKKMGVEFAPEEIKDKGVEDVIEIGLLKVADLQKKSMEDLEKSSKGSVDEQVKDWKEKYKSIETKLKETEGLLTKTSSDYEGFRKEALNKSKSDNITRFKKDVISKLEFKQDITPVEKVGFEALLSSKYDFDLDEQENPFVKDKKTGQRIPSKKVTGQFMTAEEILNEELVANKLAKINKDGGKPINKSTHQLNSVSDSSDTVKMPLYGNLFRTVKTARQA